jgi:glucosamine--fructose-6-phosphate aminotransferase (isomerizing)
MMSTQTQMYVEAEAAPGVVDSQLRENAHHLSGIGKRLRELRPKVVFTCARGSSDHAATFAKYLIETHAGVPTASFAPSVSSVYAAKQNMAGAVFLAISQSGASPDLLASATAAREAGALVIALVNVADSPLAELADEVVLLRAGPETSVAATKSYIATLSAVTQLVAAWTRSEELAEALEKLPGQLREAWRLDWQPAVEVLTSASNFFVIGRGAGLGIAQEAALKFKETSGLHAEAYSAAEVRHGPMAIVNRDFPVLIFTQDDGTRAGVDAVVEDFTARGATVLVAGKAYDRTVNLPYVHGVAASTAPIVFIQTFYKMVNALAVARDFDPDAPPHLRKVTETL